MHTDKEGRVRWTGAARYLQVAVERGIRFWPVRAFIDETGTWYGGEYLLKARKNTPKLCPACEPDPRSILDAMLPRLLETEMYQALLESSASEHASRMMAMRSASDNASDIVKDLTFSFNQARQASITREISEISAGKAAIE
jgi:hypothetical protein